MIQMDDVGWEFLDSSRSCGSHLGSMSYLECPKKMRCGYSAAPSVCFSGSAEQERGSALLLAALLIDQPATNHLAEAKAGHCDVSLRYRRHPRISIRGSGRVRACVVVGFVSLTPSVLPPAAGTPPASCCHLKTQTPKKRGKKITNKKNKKTPRAARMGEDIILAMSRPSLLRHRKTNE